VRGSATSGGCTGRISSASALHRAPHVGAKVASAGARGSGGGGSSQKPAGADGGTWVDYLLPTGDLRRLDSAVAVIAVAAAALTPQPSP
jgi:hypothetical protein